MRHTKQAFHVKLGDFLQADEVWVELGEHLELHRVPLLLAEVVEPDVLREALQVVEGEVLLQVLQLVVVLPLPLPTLVLVGVVPIEGVNISVPADDFVCWLDLEFLLQRALVRL